MEDRAGRRQALCEQLETMLHRLRTMPAEQVSSSATWQALMDQVGNYAPPSSDDIYRVFFEQAKSPKLLVDPLTGCIAHANQAAAAFYGYTQSQLTSMAIGDISCHTPEQIGNEMGAILAERRVAFHSSHRLADGSIRQVEVHSGPVLLGGRVLLYSQIHDLTDRLKIEARLRRKSQRLHNILAGTRAGSWEWFVATDEILINERWAQMLGYPRETLLPFTLLRWQRLVHPADWVQVSHTFAAHIAGTLPVVECEMRMCHSDGHWVWVLCRGQVMSTNVQGQPQLMAGIHLDISALKHAEQRLRDSEERYRALHDSLPLGCLLQDARLNILSANLEACRIFGTAASDLVGTVLPDYDWVCLREDGSPMLAEEYPAVRCLQQQSAVHSAVIGVGRAGGAVVWLRVNCQPLFHSDAGEAYAVITTLQDITAERRDQERLQLAASVFTAASEAILITDARGIIVQVNQAFSEMTGYRADEVIGQNPRLLRSGYHDADFYRQFWASLLDTGRWRGELCNRRKDGELFVEQATLSAVYDANGVASHYVCLASDISDKKQYQHQLEQQANHDLLTGLANRKLLYERLPSLMARCDSEPETKLVLAYIDLDGFKQVNDTYGHALGDQLLITLSQRMRMVLREQDLLVRIGGDEFIAVITGHGNRQDVLRLIKRLLRIVARPVVFGDIKLKVSASIGLVSYPQVVPVSADELIRQADAAMYVVKQQGKNGYWLAMDNAIS